mmetsp:Transcript_5175/g.9515  ORF Transcript_5175/g.9515 Transcript_5175/m.9515 type:complete len:135 (-) Transcript_5175:118-522(-)
MCKDVESKIIFGILYIYASSNNTFVHVTDITGKETIRRCSAGMKSKSDKDESSIYSAMLAAQDVANVCKKIGITALHVKLRAHGGSKSMIMGIGGHVVLKTFVRLGFRIGRIEDNTPLPTDGTRRKGGRRGRRI